MMAEHLEGLLAIVGKNEGDEIQVTTPNGIRNFEIIKLITIHDEA